MISVHMRNPAFQVLYIICMLRLLHRDLILSLVVGLVVGVVVDQEIQVQIATIFVCSRDIC